MATITKIARIGDIQICTIGKEYVYFKKVDEYNWQQYNPIRNKLEFTTSEYRPLVYFISGFIDGSQRSAQLKRVKSRIYTLRY